MDTQNWVPGDSAEHSGFAPSGGFAGADSRPVPVPSSLVSDALALAAEDLEQAFAIAHMGVWRWEVGSQQFRWSAEMFRIAGRDPRRFTPTLDATLGCIHADDRALVGQRLRDAVREHDPAGREFRIVRPDGTERYCWAKISTVVEEDKVVAIRGILLDLTDRREAERALQASEQHYRDTVDLSPHIPWTADPAGNVLTVSGRWTAATGLPEAAALGNSWGDQLHPDDVAAVEAAFAVSFGSGEPLDVKTRLRCLGGEMRWMRVRAFPKRDDDGRIVRWYGLSEDIHEQEATLASLRESEEHYRYTVELNPQIPWTSDPQGNILEAGPRWAEMVGIAPQSWSDALHPDDVAPTLARWGEALRTGEHIDLRYRLRQTDGTYRWFRARAGARRAESGEILRWYGLVEDIDDQVGAEAALRAREEWLRSAYEAAGIGLFEMDFVEKVAKLSSESLALLGCPPDSDALYSGDDWASLVHPDDGPRISAAIETAARTGEAYDFTFRVPLPDGGTRWITGLGRVEYDAEGKPRRLLGINIDVSAHRAAEAALQESEALNRSIVDASPDSITLIATDGEILFANQACRAAMRIEDDAQLVGRDWLDLWPATARTEARTAVAVALAGGNGRLLTRRETGQGYATWWDIVVSPVVGASDLPLRLVTVARDVTEQKSAEDRVHWSATHDPLTHLPNRRLFDERLVKAISEAEAARQGLALFVLDVDQFKQINDTLGHGAGDAVLRTLAERLCAELRSFDTVARLGGDEFALILPGVADEAQAGEVAERILARLREPVPWAAASLDCRASIGASLYPRHGTSPGDLLKHADIALYSSKARRRGELLIFDPHMRAELQERVSMTNLAREAIHDDRIRAYYQPKVDLRTGQVVGFEALARWVDGEGNIQLPAAIAAAFEDWDVSTAITDRMLAETIAQMRDWRDRGIAFGHVAINASAADFQRPDFGETVLEQLRKADIPTRCFQIEVTETVFLARAAALVERTLRLLSAEGIKIALDDFGTGYASLSHLKQFPVNIIKIDRSFVSDIRSGQEHAAIAEAVIMLGKNMGLEVVAEGVETATQATRLRELGCQYGQGFLFSPAMAADQLGDVSRMCFDRRTGALRGMRAQFAPRSFTKSH